VSRVQRSPSPRVNERRRATVLCSYVVFLLAVPAAAQTSPPTIVSGGVVNSASYVAGVSPSAWISIFGTNLASSTVTVGSADLVNGNLPTTLSGASVTIDGIPAYMDYASPTQLNVEA